MELTFWDMFFRLLAALILGAFIGWERGTRGKVAGLRTMMLVSLGAAAFTVTGIGAMQALVEAEQTLGDAAPMLRLDTSRVIAGIVGGIGFIGAGTIIQARGKVHGVTTASCIWVAAAVGVACGLSQYSVAIIVSLLSILALQFDVLTDDRPEAGEG
ncbi:MAG: magnesium transporter MgtC [Phycisphaerae bacterium]|nr:magnesium transporter MgtC [Phycisphaerae bacterium]